MKRLIAGASLLAALVLLIFLTRIWLVTDEGRIRARLDQLAGAVSETSADQGIARMARAASVTRHFTEDAVVNLDDTGLRIEGREAIAGLIARGPADQVRGRLEFVNVTIHVSESRSEATASMSAELTGTDRSTGEPVLEERAVEMTLVLRENEWLISRADVRPTPR